MSYCLNPHCQHPENSASSQSCHSCGTSLLLTQRYRAIKPIGQGGFGRTFLGVDRAQPNYPRCVIKQLWPQSGLPKATDLFHQEAARLQQLGQHNQIPQLLACFAEGDRLYLIQEFIDGVTLAQEVAERGTFNEAQIRQLLDSLLPVLHFLHQHQVIHRDIKPENIIRRRTDGQLVLVDFGAAKFAPAGWDKTGTMIGSAAYTAPEQVRGKAVFASDLYSLAVTCIYLLTHVPPFDLFDSGEDVWVWRHYLRTPISNHLGQVLDTMLQRATNRRYQSVTEVLVALNQTATQSQAVKPQKKWLVRGAIALLLAGSWQLAMPLLQHSPEPTQPTANQPETPKKASTNPGLQATSPDGQEQVFPLQHTEVLAKIAGNVSRVEVTQTFSNPFNDPLEAVYVFPLPEDAAVDDMEITVGDRIIRGVIKKREEAKQIYEQAKKEGKTTGLLEQERDNVFTQSVANIKPGEKVNVTIRYSESLKFEKGEYEFVFPTVVGPRYNPTAMQPINQVPTQRRLQAKSGLPVPYSSLIGSKAVALDNQAAPIELTSLQTHPPNITLSNNSLHNPPTSSETNPAGQKLGITVEIEAGVPISNVRSTSHPLKLTRDGRLVRLELDDSQVIPNKDLVLRYQVAGTETQSTVLTQADERGGHFATYLIPAIQYQPEQIVAKDVVFLIDTSGSQAGPAMAQSKELMRRFVQALNPNDTFTIIDFSDTATRLSSAPLPNTKANRNKAIAYINRLDANGGTELLNGIDAVLNFPAPPPGRLRSVVLLTDGLIGNDEQIIGEIQQRLKPGNRLYSFGVGSSVNRFLIQRLAEEGRGTAQVVLPDEAAQLVVEKFLQQINNPVLTNVQVTWEGSGEAPEIYPLKAPDLFVNQPLVLYGRKRDRRPGQLRVTGIEAGGKRYEKTFAIDFEAGGNPAIAQLWGRSRIKQLSNQMFQGETATGVAAITETALLYCLLSKYTAFVAVTEEVRVDANGRTYRVPVPVETPEGMQPEKIGAPDVASTPEPGQVIALLGLGAYMAWQRRRKVQTSSTPKT